MARRRFGVWPTYSAECRRDVDRLLRNGGSFSAYRSNPDYPIGPAEGSWAWRLERRAEEMFGAKHVIACSSGTMALQAALFALNLPAGSEVVTTPLTFSATVATIILAGLLPVFADVDMWGCLNPESARRAISGKTLLILPVDLFGRPVAHRFLGMGLPVLEDACQAVGAQADADEEWAGRLTKIGVWSFNGSKNVPAGEGGAVVTDHDGLAERARLYVSHGENFWPRHGESRHGQLPVIVGLNGRINELTACVAEHGLRSVLERNAARRRLAAVLRQRLSGHPKLNLPDVSGHALYCYPFLLSPGVNRNLFAAALRERGIEVSEGYIMPPLHGFPAFANSWRIPLPVAEVLSAQTLCLLTQVRPPATDADMHYIADAIEKALA